ncbi:MAG: KamA family radical SAM protein [Spirochaetales bacterium]
MSSALPERVSDYYRSLALSPDPAVDPIAAQFVRQQREEEWLPYESDDPLADRAYEVVPRLIHHYERRALVLANDQCAMYCRHCFRRHLTGRRGEHISQAEVTAVAEYLQDHREIVELVVSGGDPLVMPAERIVALLSSVRDVRPDLTFRLSTRVPVVEPSRVTNDLAEALASAGPLWLVIQCNHPAELSEAFVAAADRMLRAGIPLLNQSVLLRGVNDSVDTLTRLFEGLVNARVKPYYLFQGDLAAGTSHFRVNIDRGLDLMQELRSRVSGLALPKYAVDLPGGGGKIELTQAAVVRREKEWYVLRAASGAEYRYPRESES